MLIHIFKPFYGNISILKARHSILILTLAVAFVVPELCLAQDDSKTTFPLDHFYVDRTRPAWRKIFKNVRFGVSTGYGRTFMGNKLDGYTIYQSAGGRPEIFPNGAPGDGRVTNWVNRATTDSSAMNPGSYVISSNAAKLGFKGHALNIPLKLTLHYEYKRYRIGVGYSWEYMSLSTFHPTSHSDKIANLHPSSPSGWMKKYFVVLGASFYRIDNYLFTGDVNIGGWNPGGNFSGISKGLYYNVGVTAEREMSEYLRIFARPSYDIKSYSLALPGGHALAEKASAFYLNIGVTYTLPELPKCFKKDCKIQMNHAHGNKEYRSRVHPIWKKQNPAYGENHPELIKYKGRNKKKLNPY